MTALPAALLLSAFVQQASVAGEWAVTLTTPGGDHRFTMLLEQKEERLSGDMSNDMGQFPLKGDLNGDRIRFEWTMPDGGRLVTLRFSGTVSGRSMSGAVEVGRIGEASLHAERR